MKPKPFCPAGYEPVNDWIHKEAGRRGFQVDRHNMPNDVYCPVFDDLANYIGNHDSDEARLAVCNVNGRIEPVPVEKWRQDPVKRLKEISPGDIEFYHGLMIPTTPAKVFVRSDLRLPLEPGVIDGVAVRVEDDQGGALAVAETSPEQAAAEILRNMLADLRPGDAPPKRAEMQKLVMGQVAGLSERGFDRAFDVPEFDALHRPAGGSDRTIRAKKRRDG